MDPSLQLIFDTMNQRFDELNSRFSDRDREFTDHAASVDSRFGELVAATSALEQRVAGLESIRVDPIAATVEQRLASLEANYVDLEAARAVDAAAGHDVRVAALEKATADLAAWRPGMEGLLDDIKLEVQKLTRPRDRQVFDAMSHQPGILASSPTAPAQFIAGLNAKPPDGHGFDSTTRDAVSGVVTTWTHIPAKGTPHTPPVVSPPPSPLFSATKPPLPPNPPPRSIASDHTHQTNQFVAAQPTAPPHTGRLPKLPFPRFDGDNPRHWRSLCEDYFDMYSVPSMIWIRVAKQHLDKGPARWFQSIEPTLDFSDWKNFCRLLHDRFDRDQKELLIRQLFHVKQTSSVADYITQFTELVDQLSAYSSTTDPMYFTMRFIDGLRPEIKAIVLVLRPPDLDTA